MKETPVSKSRYPGRRGLRAGRLQVCWALFWVVLLVYPVAAGAADRPGPWQITADSLIHNQEPECIFAQGHVVMFREGGPAGLTIEADWVRYDVELGLVKARGHVSLRSPDEDIDAEAAVLDLNNNTGTLDNSVIFLKENHIYLSGRQVDKTGESTYRLRDGWASACKIEDGRSLPWRIKSADAHVTVEGMAVLKHATFQVKDVPLLYTPYLVFPAKTRRETGFLFPEWTHSSRDGFGLVTPFFINISPSMDATLYPGYLGRRGIFYGLEYRYVAAERSRGTFVLTHLRDRRQDTEEENYKSDGAPLRTDRNRYWFRGKADHDFGDNLVGRLDVDLVSDHDYLQEFAGGTVGYDQSDKQFLRIFNRGFQEETITARESTLQLTRSWTDMTLFGELKLVQDASDVPRTTTLLQSLPRLQFSGRTPLADNLFSLAWDSEYIYYWRQQGIGAHRLDLHPRLVTSLPRGGLFEGKITTGLRETLYQVESHGDPAASVWKYDRFQSRTVPDLEGNIATLFMRDFDLALGSIQWLEHSVRPNLVYDYIPSVDQKELPRLDGVDRIGARNWLTFELNNYFDVGGAGEDGSPFNRYLGYFKILETYDIREDRRALTSATDRQRVFSDLRFDLDMYPLERLRLRYQTNLSLYGLGITRYELLSRYTDARGDSLSVDYRYLRNSGMSAPYFYTPGGSSLHDIDAAVGVMLTSTLKMRAALNKSFSTDHTVESSVGLTYKPHCWMVEADYTRTTDDRRVMVIFSLDGIGRAFRWGKSNI